MSWKPSRTDYTLEAMSEVIKIQEIRIDIHPKMIDPEVGLVRIIIPTRTGSRKIDIPAEMFTWDMLEMP